MQSRRRRDQCIDGRALVRHERDGADRKSRSLEKLPESSDNDKHEEYDGEKMKRRREGDELSGKEKNYFFYA
jgi:hypothetical protein